MYKRQGQGISCLKLSRLQTDWSDLTWLCFLLAVVVFRLAGRWKGPDRLAGRMARWRVLSREKLSREMLPGQRGLASGQEESPEKVCRRVKGRILWAMGGITPVSYTHLDVYKRQFGRGRGRPCQKHAD